MFKVWGYRDGKRTNIGSSAVNKDLLKGGRYTSVPISLGPKDPSDPEGKRRLDVDEKDKEHFVLFKIYGPNPVQKPNYKGEMEDAPIITSWIPAEIAEDEIDKYAHELSAK